MKDSVRVEVAGTLDLVKQLRLDGVDGDHACGARLLTDHRASVSRDFGSRESKAGNVAKRFKAGEIAAAGLRPAFDDMTRGDGAGDRVPIVGRPAVPPRGGTDRER